MHYSIPSQISIGEVELSIRDLDRSINFYTQVMQLLLRERNSQSAELGTETTSLIRLIENPQANISQKTTGLYHFAILVPQRKNLAKSLKTIIDIQTPVQGFADHGVSEAIYLPDPDDNGIEIYRDRPQSEWPFKNGELQMITDPLNVEELLSEINGDRNHDEVLPADTTIGHMHLHVRNIPEAVAFYRDVLGLNLKQHYGSSAAFFAAGDYHHHIGVNTWVGVDAPPPPKGSAGLRSFTVTLPTIKDLDALKQNIRQAGKNTNPVDNGFSIHDPSHNRILFKSHKENI